MRPSTATRPVPFMNDLIGPPMVSSPSRVDEHRPPVVHDLAHVFEARPDGAFPREREAVAQQRVHEPPDRVSPQLRGPRYGHPTTPLQRNSLEDERIVQAEIVVRREEHRAGDALQMLAAYHLQAVGKGDEREEDGALQETARHAAPPLHAPAREAHHRRVLRPLLYEVSELPYRRLRANLAFVHVQA